MKQWNSLVLLLVLMVVAVSCAAEPEPAAEPSAAPTLTPEPSATPTLTQTSTPMPTPTSTPTQTPTPTMTPTPAPLSSKEIFNRVSPAVAFLETESRQGSGMLLDGGMVLTNAHVVWPYDKVRVLFPDGSEFTDVPVANWDLMADLALLGPIETEIASIEFSSREDLEVGSETYLLGYPGEVDEYPQPTITQGLISRVREWEPMGITFFQTDASIGGGQSGGLMVTEYGEIIGISTFVFSDAEFGLVASAVDIQPRIDSLLGRGEASDVVTRQVPRSGGRRSDSSITIDNRWDAAVYVLDVIPETEVEISVDGGGSDMAIAVYDDFGWLVTEADEVYEGEEAVSFTTYYDGPYFVTLYRNNDANSDALKLLSNVVLYPLDDPDDGRGLTRGQEVTGSLDYPKDADYYNLFLNEGQAINVAVQSISVDPVLIIGREGADDAELLVDDDSGGGVFGADAEMSFTAPQAGIYHVVVGDASGYDAGGYLLAVRDVYEGAPTPMAPPPTPEPVLTEFGAMNQYTAPASNLNLLYPLDWSAGGSGDNWFDEICDDEISCFGGEYGVLTITEEKMARTPVSELDELVALDLSIAEESGIEILDQDEFASDSGIRGVVLTLNLFDLLHARQFVVLENEVAVRITYFAEPENADEVWPTAEFSFASLEELE